MLKAMLRGLLAHKLRLVLSALAVILGTAFMTAAFVSGDTIKQGFHQLFSTVNENIDVQVTGKNDLPSENGQNLVTAVIPQSVVDRLKTVPGAQTVTPQVFSEGARVIGKDGKVIQGNARFGAGWPSDLAEVNTVLREGSGPTQDNQVAINAELAKKGDFKVGDTIEVLTLEPRKSFTVTGIVGIEGGRDSLGGETIVYFTLPVAQQLMLNAPGSYSNVDLKATAGVTPDQLKQRTIEAIGNGYTVRTGKETADAQSGVFDAFLSVFSTGLAVFGFLALFTGAFLIFNTFSMLIAQRTRELALYRSFGANKGQVLRSVLLESVLLGLIASLIGLGIGVLLGFGLVKLLGAIGNGGGLPTSGVVLKPYVVILTLLAGTLITMLAAFLPALRAARVAPIEAMRDAAKPDKPLRGLTIAGLILMALGITLLILKGTKTVTNSVLTLGGGMLLTFIGAVLIAPALSRPVTAGIGKLVSLATPGQLGVRNTGRNPRRTALTAAALMIGVTLATGAGVFAASTKAGLTNVFEQDLKADLLLQTDFTAGPTAGFDPALAKQISSIPGVTDVAVLHADQIRLGNKTITALATDAGAAAKIFTLQTAAGSLRTLNKGEVILPDSEGASVGSTVTMQTARGITQPLTVVGTYAKSNVLNPPSALLSPEDASGFRSPLAQQAYVKVATPGQIPAVRAEMNKLVADNPEVTVSDPSSQIKQATSFLDLLLNVLNVLLGLTILVAVLGVINTLLLSVFERTRELGLLRAIGLSRGRMGWMITVEAVLISVFGALLGMILGTALGVTLVKIFGGEFLKLTIPWGYLIVTLVAAIIAGLVAALLPAIRAARLNVLQAIAYE